MAVPYTEQRHPASSRIDHATPEEIARLMMREEEVFVGWDMSEGILKPSVLETISSLQMLVSDVLQDTKNNAIVLAGCGTSGRLGFMTCRTMNAYLRQQNKTPCFKYLMAGNDIALFTSQEGYEDKPLVGVQDLQKACEAYRRVLYVGITCGLSAPYVAGQLDFCMQHLDKFTPVLIGFNSIDMARSLPIEKWHKTFLDVAVGMEKEAAAGRAFLLNPIVGPELITGSSRMKAGTATKILLDVIFKLSSQKESLEQITRPVLNIYHESLTLLHTIENDIIMGSMIEIAADSLKHGGHVYYVGDESLGLVGMIDASECPPTYGASPEGVRGFLKGGYNTLQNTDGDLSDQFPIDIEHFKTAILPQTTAYDLVVILTKDSDLGFVPSMNEYVCRRLMLNIKTQHNQGTCQTSECKSMVSTFDTVLEVDLTASVTRLPKMTRDILAAALAEISTKWLCNTLSTGAHILIGKVYENLMVDVNVSNSKLYHRAAGIIRMLVGCDNETAYQLLLKSIYMCEDVRHQLQFQVSKHLEISGTKQKVVPLALVMGIARCCVKDAVAYLDKYTVITRAIQEIIKGT